MPNSDFFLGIALAMFSALLTVVSLYAMGRLLLERLKSDRFGHDLAVGLGFGINHLAFLAVSLFLDGPHAVLFMNILHSVVSAVFLFTRKRVSLSDLRFDLFPALFLGVVFIPYLYRLVSPLMNVDGLNYYLTSTVWVYHRGLEFNPHLTAYTTMPMAAEYLFAQAYGLGGTTAVALTDAVFCVLSVNICHRCARMVVPRIWAWVFTLSILLIPHSFTYLFGSVKVDMVNLYLVLISVSMLLRPMDPQGALAVLSVLSMTFAVKYTSWLQFFLPTLACIVYLLASRAWRLAMFGCMVPLLFSLPVLVKNQIQVGNPLAPVVWSPRQTVYLASHTSNEGQSAIEPAVKPQNMDKPLRVIARLLYQSMIFILYLILAVLLPIAFLSGFDFRKWRYLLVFLLLSLLSWHAYVGVKLEPIRFTLAFLVSLSLLFVHVVHHFLEKVSEGAARGVALALAVILSFLNLVNSHAIHGDLVDRFRDARRSGVTAMYEADQKRHYAVSRVMADEGWLGKKVMFMAPLVLGTLTYQELLKSHTDLEIFLNRRDFESRVSSYDYIYCTKPDITRFRLADRRMILDYGHYCLLEN